MVKFKEILIQSSKIFVYTILFVLSIIIVFNFANGIDESDLDTEICYNLLESDYNETMDHCDFIEVSSSVNKCVCINYPVEPNCVDYVYTKNTRYESISFDCMMEESAYRTDLMIGYSKRREFEVLN